MTMRIGLADPAGEYGVLGDEIDAAVAEVLRGGRYILGPEVESFEQEVASYLGAAHAVGTSSGTDAIQAALLALGVGPGDEVITTSFSFFATAGSILRVGARPVFVDIEPDGFNLDPGAVEAAVTGRTRAILVVHLFGQPADMPAIESVARRAGVRVVEDAAQAFGAVLGDRKIGSALHPCCFSFFPAKPFGAAGDGGLVTTGDADLAGVLRSVRVQGATGKNMHGRLGGNFRLDAIQAAILRVKLRRMDEWIAARRRNAAILGERLSPLEERGLIRLPREREGTASSWAQYTVRTSARDALGEGLGQRGVASAVYYPLTMPAQEVMGTGVGRFPRAEKACLEVLSIPVHHMLDEAQIGVVASAVEEALGGTEGRG